jgi:hypothetical protein
MGSATSLGSWPNTFSLCKENKKKAFALRLADEIKMEGRLNIEI